jgi:outer membrane protein OmpA-like peptidoglycan-associated protein
LRVIARRDPHTSIKLMKNFLVRTALVLTLAFLVNTVHAQSTAGRIAFGIDAGGNKYYGNFTDNQFAFAGDAFIRWNIMDALSVHLAYNGGQIHYAVAPNGRNVTAEPGYFGSPYATEYPGTTISRDPINVVRFGGWQAMVSGNVFPSQTFVPYFIGGLEMLNFEPRTQTTDASLPNNAAGKYSKNVLGGVLGTGFEMYLSPKITFNAKGLLHLTGTDWLDDYSNPSNSSQDAYITMGAGFSYYIFTPDLDVQDQSTTTITHREIVETTTHQVDTLYINQPADTVYIAHPRANTIYNFPGTLFIVGTDQFNNDEPNNMRNLYQIKRLVNQCDGIRVVVEGYSSDEGEIAKNQRLSELRALRVRNWLIEQGVSEQKIIGTKGFGEAHSAVYENTNGTATSLEAERTQNRRIAIRVVESCD